MIWKIKLLLDVEYHHTFAFFSHQGVPVRNLAMD